VPIHRHFSSRPLALRAHERGRVQRYN